MNTIEYIANTKAYLFYTAGMSFRRAVFEFVKEVYNDQMG
jgi:hypothetical protein